MPEATTDLTLTVLALPFIAAAIAPLAVRAGGYRSVWFLSLAPAVIFIFLLGQAGEVASGAVLTGGIDWIPSLGARLSYAIDGLSFVFGLLIAGIGTFIIIYSGGYLKGHPQLGRFLMFMFLFMGSMLGLVMADNLFAFLVMWELTSITSFLLIGFDHNRRAARRGALQALVVTGAGGLALIAAAFAIQNVTGVLELSRIVASGDMLRDSPSYGLILVLVLAGAFTKSAQFPLHFWLPNAMEAPTPVSAYLHSATMVKAGVYLLMRMNPVLGDTVAWGSILPVFGGATLIVGTLLAIRQTDLKLMLAQTTVASLGLMVMLTGFGSERAIEAAVYYLFAHSLFKGSLFMVAGTIDHEAGTRDIRKLAGLRRAMPITFAAAAIAALSMAGIPPFIGFLAKEEIYAAVGAGDPWSILVTMTAVVGNALMLVIAVALAVNPFFGDRPSHLVSAHEGSPLLWAGPVALAIAGLVSAVFADATNHGLISPMAGAIAGVPVDAHAALALHVGLPLLLSAVTIAAGIAAFTRLRQLRYGMARILAVIGWGPDRGFDQAMDSLVRGATILTRFIQNGRLENYMMSVFVVAAFALFLPLLTLHELPRWPAFPDLEFYEWSVMAIAVLGLIAVMAANDRLTAIVSLGIQGFAVALIYMLFGAPDLAFTQFMVETLSVVILALVMTRLTLHKSDHRPPGQTIVDGCISLATACGLGLLLLSVTQLPFNDELSVFFAQNSLTVAHGRNIVNVIIVDFRGLDTLGEIAVVMVAGLAILGLIRIRHRAPMEAAIRPAGEASEPGELEGGK